VEEHGDEGGIVLVLKNKSFLRHFVCLRYTFSSSKLDRRQFVNISSDVLSICLALELVSVGAKSPDWNKHKW
jgi:hypothetical protein